ncbi:MAG TPA: hypothetical protein VMS22_12355, partial [Candidatus Eisenbacteria bacterium]|nr:hypothetical protein [Candidatus Eisenbacteria bacterium]
MIDGSGLMGHSWFSSPGSAGVRWSFDPGTLGGLPTAPGIVWTDGGAGGTVSFEAVAADGSSVICATGPVSDPGVFPDSSNNGETGEDRFFGLYDPDGISSILLSNSSGGIEMDHLQFGLVGLAASTSTTTTTLPGACLLAPTYESILCRIDTLVGDVTSAGDLGRLKQGILNAITKARQQAAKAAGAGTGKVAKNQLKKVREEPRVLPSQARLEQREEDHPAGDPRRFPAARRRRQGRRRRAARHGLARAGADVGVKTCEPRITRRPLGA